MEDGLYMTESICQQVKDLPTVFGILASCIPGQAMQAAAKYQEDVVQLIFALPGNLRYEQVNAALKASGYTPYSLYLVASAGKSLPESFREALHGPNYAANSGKTL